jgi:hypothetical protein
MTRDDQCDGAFRLGICIGLAHGVRLAQKGRTLAEVRSMLEINRDVADELRRHPERLRSGEQFLLVVREEARRRLASRSQATPAPGPAPGSLRQDGV